METSQPADSLLHVHLWGTTFPNPIGAAAGYDTDGTKAQHLLDVGFGFIEVGTVLPKPQPGDPTKPWLFKLPEDSAVINRCGFTFAGADSVAQTLEVFHASDSQVNHRGVVAVNLGKNGFSDDAAADYIEGVHKLAKHAAYLVVNVSSPTSAGLSACKTKDYLKPLLQQVLTARDEEAALLQRLIPLLIKISPDLTEQDLADIADVALELHLDGMVVANTTLSRPDTLQSPHKTENGGLSGLPLRDLSTRIVREMFARTHGKIPLIGVGGVSTGKDAYDKIKAGASLVQVLTCVYFEGEKAIPRINQELAELLLADGYTNVAQAVGAAHKNTNVSLT